MCCGQVAGLRRRRRGCALRARRHGSQAVTQSRHSTCRLWTLRTETEPRVNQLLGRRHTRKATRLLVTLDHPAQELALCRGAWRCGESGHLGGDPPPGYMLQSPLYISSLCWSDPLCTIPAITGRPGDRASAPHDLCSKIRQIRPTGGGGNEAARI